MELPPDMWVHYCPNERDYVFTGKGEPCSWCGEVEHANAPETEEQGS